MKLISDNNASKEKSGATFAIVAFVVFVDMLGIGLIFPVLPFLIQELGGFDMRRAAEVGGLLIFAYAFMQFLFAPIIGGVSDTLGRRPVLLVTLSILGLCYVAMAFASSLVWLAVARTLSGIMGAAVVTANSTIADSVPLAERGKRFGILSGAGALGYVFGPAIGGLAGEFDTRLPFVIAAILAFLGFAIGFFLLRETLPPENRRPFSFKRANPLGSLIRISNSKFVLGCLITTFLIYFGAQSQYSIWPYWGALKFGWTPMLAGLSVAFYGILLAISQAYFTGKSIARFGASKTVFWSLSFAVPSYLLLAWAPSNSFVMMAIIVGVIPGMALPALQSLMTAEVDPNAQGELQGAIASTSSLAVILGPIIATQIFSHFSDGVGYYLPGAPFLFSAFLVLIAVVILRKTLFLRRQS